MIFRHCLQWNILFFIILQTWDRYTRIYGNLVCTSPRPPSPPPGKILYRPLARLPSADLLRIKLASEMFRKILDYPVGYDEEKMEAVVQHPGLMYDDYDINTRQPKMWQIMKIGDSCYECVYGKPIDKSGRYFRDWDKITKHTLLFTVSCKITLNKNLYDTSIPKRPLKVISRGGYVGNTSVASTDTFMSQDGRHLWTTIMQNVVVDSVTRRPTPLPDWWKAKYVKFGGSSTSLKLTKIDKPDNTFEYQTTVWFSDTDTNGHTNWASYVRYAFDAAHHWARKGHMKYFQKYHSNGVTELEMLFSGECFEGDVVNVHIWESESERVKIIAHVYKDQVFLFQMTIQLFED